MTFLYLHIKRLFVILYLALLLKIVFQMYIISNNAYTQLYLDLAPKAG